MSTKGIDVKIRNWTKAAPCKTPDNIVSSKYTNAKVFVPSYERERRPCMEQLLTNEYQRIWWQEKEVWDKRFARKSGTKKLLQRMVIRRKPPTPSAIKTPRRRRKLKGKTESKMEDAREGKTREKGEQHKDKLTKAEETGKIYGKTGEKGKMKEKEVKSHEGAVKDERYEVLCSAKAESERDEIAPEQAGKENVEILT